MHERFDGLCCFLFRVRLRYTALFLGMTVLLSTFVLDHVRLNSGLSLGETKRALQRLVFVKTKKRGFQLATLQPAPAEDLEQMEEIKTIMRKQLWRGAGMKIHRKPLMEKAA